LPAATRRGTPTLPEASSWLPTSSKVTHAGADAASVASHRSSARGGR
jgi:hypothetical protein